MKEISGDKPLGKKDKIIYLISNFFRGIRGYASWIRIKYWYHQKLETGNGSPARKFLNQFLFNKIPEFIPNRYVNVLDIGCGSGYVREILSSLGYGGKYTGVDISRHIKFDENNYNFKSNFIESKIENFETLEKFDFIFTISALEHIEKDSLAVSKCDNFLSPGGVQIHIVPSFWALFLYLWHGYRQYNPSFIKKLIKRKNSEIYKLGGVFSFFLHLFFITVPLSILKRNIHVNKLTQRGMKI